VAAARGGDPDQLKDVQAYLAVKLRDKGPLDFQQAGGQDTSWIQVGEKSLQGRRQGRYRGNEGAACGRRFEWGKQGLTQRQVFADARSISCTTDHEHFGLHSVKYGLCLGL
jgi:hypothetical protein